MDPEIAKLIDTALKIGLGAAIGIIGTYIQHHVAHKHNKDKMSYEKRISILESIE